MDLSPRQSEIAALVENHGFVSVEDLSQRYGVTTQTIRRDVNRLCAIGLMRRTHGGAEPLPLLGTVHRNNLGYGLRQVLHLAAKQRIAQLVARYVPHGASLALSIGTTPEMVMRALRHHKGLRIFTNNLNVAMVASEEPDWQVTIAGGRLRNGDRDLLGPETQAFFQRYRFDFGIFGVAGVEADGTLLDFHEDEVDARRAIQDNSRQSFLVLDHSKFGRAAHVRGGRISEVSRVFTDKPPPQEFQALLASGPASMSLPGTEASK